MHTRIAVIASHDPQKWREQIEKHVIPTLQGHAGFRGGYWLSSARKALGVTFWESPQALSGSRSVQERLRELSDLQKVATFTEFRELEVIADTGEKVHRDARCARVVEITGDPGKLAQATTIIQERAIPSLQQMEGFCGGVWMADRKSGKGLVVLLFETEAALGAVSQQIDQLRARAMSEVGAREEAVYDCTILTRAEVPVGSRR